MAETKSELLIEWPKYWLSTIPPPEIIPDIDEIMLPGKERLKFLKRVSPFFADAIVFVKIPKRKDIVPLLKSDMHRKESEFKYKTKYTWTSL